MSGRITLNLDRGTDFRLDVSFEIPDKGITVLFVSHSVEQVLNICNKAIILDHGRLIASGSAEEICAQYNEMVKKK